MNSIPPDTNLATRSNPIHVLVIDDDDLLCEAVKELLESFDFEVTTVTDGEAAMRLLVEESLRIDLVVLDATIPSGPSGFQIYSHIRRFHEKLPIVIASGYDRDSLISRHPECAEAVFIQKPWAIHHLVDVLCEAIAQQRSDQ